MEDSIPIETEPTVIYNNTIKNGIFDFPPTFNFKLSQANLLNMKSQVFAQTQVPSKYWSKSRT